MRRTKIGLSQLPPISGAVNKITKVDSAYSVLSDDITIIANKETDFNITLPLTSDIGKTYYFKNIGVGVVTIFTSGSDILDNITSLDLIQWDTTIIQCYDSGKWAIMLPPIGMISTLLDLINGEEV